MLSYIISKTLNKNQKIIKQVSFVQFFGKYQNSFGFGEN